MLCISGKGEENGSVLRLGTLGAVVRLCGRE